MEPRWPRPGILFHFDQREPLPPEFQHLEANFVGHRMIPDDGGGGWPHIRNFRGGGPGRGVDAFDAVGAGPGMQPRNIPPQRPDVGQIRRQTVLLPPSKASVKVQIIEDTATITMEHLFENTTAFLLKKARYQFPLPHDCSIVDFKCLIGKRTMLKGVVEPRRVARNTFEHAVNRDRPAGLVEQDTPEIFKTSIGNIPAHKKVAVVLSFIILLKHSFSLADNVASTALTLPTYIAPRYGIAPVDVLEAGPRKSETSLSIQIEALSSDEIIGVSSDTHDILVERGVGRRQCQRWADFVAGPAEHESTAAAVKLVGNVTSLDKDFVVCFKTRPSTGAEMALACIEVHPQLDNHRALMITIPPKFMLRDLSPNDNGEIVFLADRSGSMDDKLEGLKSAMQFFIRGIPQSRSFNIWCFGSSYTSLWPNSHRYDQQTMSEALDYVASDFRSDMGGTELLPALKAIVGTREANAAMDIVILTDGEVWRQDETIKFVETSRRAGEGRLRFFALGIGNAVSHDLIEGIARHGGGYSEVIPIAIKDNWESRMVAVLSAALTGHCGPLYIELDDKTIVVGKGVGDSAAAVHRSPFDVSTLSPFIRNRIFYLFEGKPEGICQSVRIKALDAIGAEICKTLPVRRLGDDDLKIHKFAARSLLGDLERGCSWIHRSQAGTGAPMSSQEDLVRKEGERLGCKWSLVSNWTSFVAVKEVVTDPERDQPPVGPDQGMEGDELGLLRRRGRPGAGGRLPPAHRAEDDEHQEEGESESESESDRTTNDQGSGENSDNNDDDDAGDGGGVGPGYRPHGGGGSHGKDRGGGNKGGRRRQDYRKRMSDDSPPGGRRDSPTRAVHANTVSGSLTNRSLISRFGSQRRSRPMGPTSTSSSYSLGTSNDPQVNRLSYASYRSGELDLDYTVTMEQEYDVVSSNFMPSFSASSSFSLELPRPPEISSFDYDGFSALSSEPARYIPPSSTAMMPAGGEAIATERALRDKTFVRRIISFQQANGSFQFADDSEMRRTIGDKVADKLAELRGIQSIVALAALLAALLEARFQSCHSLWSLAVSKAQDFVRSSLAVAAVVRRRTRMDNPPPYGASLEAGQVLEHAKDLVAGITLEDLNFGEDFDEPIEVLTAPVDARITGN